MKSDLPTDAACLNEPGSSDAEESSKFKRWSKNERQLLRKVVQESVGRALTRRLGSLDTRPLKSIGPGYAVNWEEVAVDMNSRRSELEYALEWNSMNAVATPWTSTELEQLYRVVEASNPSDTAGWLSVAGQMSTWRSVADCKSHYRMVNPKLFRWSEEEDRRLREAVKAHGTENWTLVSQLLETRTPEQCRARYVNSLAPQVRKGRWTPAEDETLREAVLAHGTAWTRVAEAVEGRTNVQCRERYHTLLKMPPEASKSNVFPRPAGLAAISLRDTMASHEKTVSASESASAEAVATPETAKTAARPNPAPPKRVTTSKKSTLPRNTKATVPPPKAVKKTPAKGPWQSHEDSKLIKSFLRHGDNWELIAAEIEGRSKVQCRTRYKIIQAKAEEEEPAKGETSDVESLAETDV